MDWKLLGSTFALIFLAEVGDKTQIAILTIAAGGKSRLAVFVGAAAALAATTLIAVLLGEGLARVVPHSWLERAAGALFVVLGVLYLLGKG
jgi:Ca2+/H+ antiporter, TMEM165/GDT1 family